MSKTLLSLVAAVSLITLSQLVPHNSAADTFQVAAKTLAPVFSVNDVNTALLVNVNMVYGDHEAALLTAYMGQEDQGNFYERMQMYNEAQVPIVALYRGWSVSNPTITITDGTNTTDKEWCGLKLCCTSPKKCTAAQPPKCTCNIIAIPGDSGGSDG